MFFDEECQSDLGCLINFIATLSGSEKALSQSALDFQAMGLAKKHQIEAAIDRASDLGKALEVLIELLNRLLYRFKD